MQFRKDEFIKYRKLNRWSRKAIANKLNVSNMTLYRWEKGETVPNEEKIRNMASLLNIPVNKISDLEKEYPVSEKTFSKSTKALVNFFQDSNIENNAYAKLFNNLLQIKTDLDQVSMIIKTFMRSNFLMIYFKDINSKFIFANDAFLKNIFNTTETKVIGKTDHDLFSKKEAVFNEKQDNSVIHNAGAIINYEDFIPGSKKKKWGLISKCPIFDSSKKISGVAGIFIDVTEKKKKEQINDLLETVLSDSRDILSIREFPPSYKMLYISKSVIDIYGYSDECFIKDKNFWYRHCLTEDALKQHLHYRKTGIWPEKYEHQIICANGEKRWVETTASKKEFMGKMCICFVERDITARKKDEERRKFLEASVQAMTDGFTIVDMETGEYLYMNHIIEKIFGYSNKIFFKKQYKFWLNVCVHPDDKIITGKNRKNLGNMINNRYRIIHPDGKIKWIEDRLGGKVSYSGRKSVILLSRDITDQVEIEEENKRLQNMLESK